MAQLTDTDQSELECDEPCLVCDTPPSYRRCVRIPRANETYKDEECTYCGAILRYFTVYLTFEEFDEKMFDKKFLKGKKIHKVDENDTDDKIQVVYRRM